MTKTKQLSPEAREKIVNTIKMLLHAGRDCMRNQNRDTKVCAWDVNNPYYAEALGMLRTLEILGYGNFTLLRLDIFDPCARMVLIEEHFDSTQECDWCVEHHGKDGAGRKR